MATPIKSTKSAAPDLGAFFKSPAGKAPRSVLALQKDGHVAIAEPPEEEPGHVHGPGCGHHHAPKKKQARPPQNRPAEGGGLAVQLALDQLLPEETDEVGIFDQFEKLMLGERGVSKVHIRRDLGRAEICIHYDSQISPTKLVDLATRSGAECTERFERLTWFVRGLESADSAAPLETLICKLPGVLTANVAYAAERLVVEFDTEATNADAIMKRVRELGYELEVPEHGHACSMHAHGGGLAPWLQMPLAIGAGALLAGGFAISKLAPAALPSIAIVTVYIVALVAAAIFPLRAAIIAIRAKQVDVETLMILAGVGAAVLGAYFEGAFLLFLFTLGHALEHRAMERARRSIESLGQLTAKTARVRRDNQVVEISTKKVAIGDVVIVREGDRVPLDGVIREGSSMIDQATITGESVPVARGPGDKVFAGTINTDAVIEVEVTSLAGDTLLARIVDMVTEAEAQKSATQRFVQRLEKKFVPLVLVIAAVVPVALIAFGTSWQLAVLRGVSLIVAASPCALAISTPSAVLAAVSRAARGGVLIKGGAHLESLGKVRAIAFDKTGTLTHGKPRLLSVVAADGASESDLLATAAGLEGLSSHPLAKAVLAGATERSIAPLPAEQGDAVHGKGIQGKVAGKPVKIGNASMFEAGTVPEAILRASDT
ncbi:MAG TPA: cation-translocating P-type ATPase, partial [Kofleriaceae bacterium]|nr:cation-translocating P-type ATPase [Kofleriaceae bacterium]